MCKYNNIGFTNNIWKLWMYNDIGFTNNIWKLWKYNDIGLNKNNSICLITYNKCVSIKKIYLIT